jgi:hypothetical protein
MPALSYQARFVSLVVSGAKPHSIRAWRRRPFKNGDVLMHYTAMRTKQCRKIRPDTLCTSATPIEVNARRGWVITSPSASYYPIGRLSARWIERLAQRDGFASADDFFAFFKEAHAGMLCGQLVEWNPFAFVAGAEIQEGDPVCIRDGRAFSIPGARSVGVQAECTPQARALGAPTPVGAANPTTSGPRSPSNFSHGCHR